MGFAAQPLLVVVSPSPMGLENGAASKLMKGLTQKLGTSQPPMNPTGFATFLGDRSNTGELLHVGGEFKSVAVGTESRQETRRQNGAGTRKAGEQRGIVMFFEQRGDLLIVVLNGCGQVRNLFHQGLDHHGRGQQNRFIFGQWSSFGD